MERFPMAENLVGSGHFLPEGAWMLEGQESS